MELEIYYFTGTGNSLAVAKDIADKTESKLFAIKEVISKEAICPKTNAIGIVFPAYYMLIPRIVERFIIKLEGIENKYIFSIITVGGIAGDVVAELEQPLSKKKSKLSANFIVRMPANYIDGADALPAFIQKRMFRKWNKRAENIINCINKRSIEINRRFNPLMTFLFSKHIVKERNSGLFAPDIDKHFWVNGNCNLCGICLKICPVGNVSILNKKVKWGNNCEKCLACIQWCPEEAIQFNQNTIKRTRYHHPNVTLREMIGNNYKP